MTGKNKQIKSKKRVAEHGEVYTNKREVDAMLDLVKSECAKIESTFLEPACGNGNFLVEILKRKLKTVKKKFGKTTKEYEINLLIAVGSIYGIDILNDNCEESRNRMLKIVESEYKRVLKKPIDPDFQNSIKTILKINIINGDALTGLTIKKDPIVFAEWTVVNDGIKRRDYLMNEMMAYSTYEDKNNKILYPKTEYPLTNYKELNKLLKEK